MTAAKEGQGGLIALSVNEADLLLEWYVSHDVNVGRQDNPECVALALRLEEWRSRHTEAAT